MGKLIRPSSPPWLLFYILSVCSSISWSVINPTHQKKTVKMNNNQFDRRASGTPRHTRNTRAHGDAQMVLPKAAHSAALLRPTNLRGRSTNADGSFNNNVPYLILTPQSQGERRTLITNISNFLGNDMSLWHQALHCPQGLPENALDWSTVLLQRTYDLARSISENGNGTVAQWRQGVYQAMSLTPPRPYTFQLGPSRP